MFVNSTYLYIYDDEKVDEDCSQEPWVVNMCRLMTPDDTSSNVEK
jgi:hypothetical protein